MAVNYPTTIPARGGKAAFIKAGQHVKVINTHGQQVVDTWAFNQADLEEFMSMEHSRTALGRIMADVGDSMVTNHRRPMLSCDRGHIRRHSRHAPSCLRPLSL